MKIIHIAASRSFFGSERYAAELAGYQSRAGYDVAVIAGAGNEAFRAQWRHEIGGATRLVTPPRWLPSFFLGWWMCLAVWRLQPDIVHLHLLKGTRFLGLIKKAAGFGMVASLHIRYRRKYHDACDGLILVTESQRGSLEDYRGRAVTIWNWLGPRHLAAPRADGAAFRAEIGVGAEEFLFLCVARLTPVKGLDILVQAFMKAFPGRADTKLAIVGDGEEKRALEVLIGQDRRITLIGFREAEPDVFRACDALVSAARFEPFGLTILEAMATGCPLVLTRTAGPTEFLKDDARVIWVAVNDVDNLAAGLAEAVARGKNRVVYDMTPFDLVHAAAKIEALYVAILGRKAAG
ncbi:MAG: glycosyltransferase family 4 protein [Alphaproteobacteria bacterium]|nr:glycosyltransferase family 4 protein [Alphaproteobacteria bacterium]